MHHGDIPHRWLCCGGSNNQGMEKVVTCTFLPIICKSTVCLCHKIQQDQHFNLLWFRKGFTQLNRPVLAAMNFALLCP